MSSALAFSRDGDFVVAPALRHLGFDFVEIALVRLGDVGDGIPDIAAVGVDRIVVDADIGRVGRVDDIGGVRNVGDRLAVRIAAGPVDIDR